MWWPNLCLGPAISRERLSASVCISAFKSNTPFRPEFDSKCKREQDCSAASIGTCHKRRGLQAEVAPVSFASKLLPASRLLVEDTFSGFGFCARDATGVSPGWRVLAQAHTGHGSRRVTWGGLAGGEKKRPVRRALVWSLAVASVDWRAESQDVTAPRTPRAFAVFF